MLRLTPLLALVSLPALAATVNINPGDDVGTLTGAPGPGDQFIFHDGVYELENGLNWTGLGTAEQPILFTAAEGATPVFQLSGGGNVVRLADSTFVQIVGLTFSASETGYEEHRVTGLNIHESSDILIDGLTVEHIGGTGLYLSGNNSRLHITGAHIHDTRDGSGIYVGCGDASCWTQDSTIELSWLHDLRGEQSRGILVEHGGQNLTIADNVIYQTGHRGLRTSSTEFGEPNLITGNVIWSTVHDGIRVNGSATVQNNVVFNIDGYGISSSDNSRGTMGDVRLSHNTIVDTSDYGVLLENWAAYEGLVFTNNVVANPIGRAVRVYEEHIDVNVRVAGNVFTGLVDAPFTVGDNHFAVGFGYADFEAVDAWDFYPTSGAPSVNGADPDGASWVPLTDFNGAERDGLAPDAGAYEYSGAGNPGWVIKEGFKELGVRPDSGEEVGGGCGKKNSEGGEAALLLFPLLFLVRRRE